MAETAADWESLPDHLLLKVFRHLSDIRYLHNACLVNKKWHETFLDPSLWRTMGLTFATGVCSEKLLTVIPQFGIHFRNVTIHVAQEKEEHRILALRALQELQQLQGAQYETLTVEFIGQNPLFYGGQEFTDGLKGFFSTITENTLSAVDLGGFTGKISDDLIATLAKHHSQSLKQLSIQNKQMVCQVSPEGFAQFMEQCRNMVEVHIYCCSMSDRMVKGLMEPNRVKLDHLSIYCSAQDKFNGERHFFCLFWTFVNCRPTFRHQIRGQIN